MNRPQRIIHRGELYYADLNPVFGSEQGGIRPVLILQNEVGNWFSPTVIVAAVTAKSRKGCLPTHVLVGTDSGLRKSSIILTEQVRTIDQIPVVGLDRGAFPREAGTGRPGAACKLRPFTKVRGGSRMDAKGIINYYGMLRILKALEGHGFTQKELKRITAHLELEVERGLFCSQSKQAA